MCKLLWFAHPFLVNVSIPFQDVRFLLTLDVKLECGVAYLHDVRAGGCRSKAYSLAIVVSGDGACDELAVSRSHCDAVAVVSAEDDKLSVLHLKSYAVLTVNTVDASGNDGNLVRELLASY